MKRSLYSTPLLSWILAAFLTAGFGTTLVAQDGGGGAGGGGATGGDTGGATGGNTGGNTGGTTGGTTTNQNGQAQAPDLTEGLANIDLGGGEDRRNQGFVGVTGQYLTEFGFVGAASENSGPAIVEDKTFGGGVNDGFVSPIPSGSGGGGGAPGGRAGGFTGATSSAGIVRQGLIRTRVRPAFAAPQYNGTQTLQRFNQNFYRQPTSANVAGQYNISIQNKTATITGSVQNQAAADQIVRQLRLQPGVYKIDNRLNVSQ